MAAPAVGRLLGARAGVCPLTFAQSIACCVRRGPYTNGRPGDRTSGDVTNFQNRKETAKALVAAGRTYFDYYNHKREEAAGNPNCGGKLDLYGASGISY